MATNDPLRNRTFYGTADGRVATSPGDAAGYRQNARPVAPPTPQRLTPEARASVAAARGPAPLNSLAPNTKAAAPAPAPARAPMSKLKVAGVAGGAAAGVGLEAWNLAQTARDEGRDAALAEAPRSGGRLAGAGLGASTLMRMAPKHPAAKLAAGAVGGAVGAYGGQEAVDYVSNIGNGTNGRVNMPRPYDQTDSDGRSFRWGNGPNAVPTPEYRPDFSNVASGANTVARPNVRVVDGSPESIAQAPQRPVTATSNVPGDGFIQVGDRPARGISVSQADRDASREAAANMLPTTAASRNTAGNVYQTTRRTAGDIDSAALNTRNRITSAMLNPMGNDAELMRRLENSQSSYMNKGSPQARRMIGQAYLDALGGGREADLKGLGGQTDAYLGGADNEAKADEGYAQRSDDASQFNIDTAESRRVADQRTGLGLAALRQKTMSEAADRESANATSVSDRYQDVWDKTYADSLAANGGDVEAAAAAANQLLETQERREGLRSRDDSPFQRAAALQESDMIEQQYARQHNGGLGNWFARRILDVEGGDPLKSGSHTLDPMDWAPADPKGIRQNLGSLFGVEYLENQNTGRQIATPKGSSRARERAAAERGERRRTRDGG